MLLHLPRKYRSEDDDYAPLDYNYVDSVQEGARREQVKPIHQKAENGSVRHRATPTDWQGSDGRTPPDVAEPRGYEAARRMPNAADGPAPAERIAYPRRRDNAFAQTPAYTPAEAEPLQAAQAMQTAQAVQTRRAYPARQEAPDSSRYAQETDTPTYAAPYGTDGLPPEGATGRVARNMNARMQNDAQGSSVPREDAPVPEGRAMNGYATPAQEPPSVGVLPGDSILPDGSQFAKPAQQAIPDWLRVAQQNNMPYGEEQRRRAPRVEPAPRQPQEPLPTDMLGRPIARRPQIADRGQGGNLTQYEAAGYPPELIDQQRTEDQVNAQRLGEGRKRHGAQLAAPPPQASRGAGRESMRRPGGETEGIPPREAFLRSNGMGDGLDMDRRRPTYAPRGNAGFKDADGRGMADASPRNPYPPAEDSRAAQKRRDPWTDEIDGDEPPEEERTRPQIPYLGIVVFVAVALVVALWIMQMTFTAQREQIITARAQTIAKQATSNPYSYRELIEREAQANNLHPAFVAAIVLNESSFDPNAESEVGARGLMQMMPDTAEWVHGKMGLTDEYSFDLMFDAETNVHYACWYLAFLAQRFHNDPILVSAAFHAGQTTVQNWLNDSRYSVDSQSISLDKMAEGPTKNYATRVLKSFAVYRRLYYEGGLEQAQAIVGAAQAALTSTLAPG